MLAITGLLRAQVPQLISYQGRVAVAGSNFEGPGQFKFALVNANGTTTYWSNDGTSAGGAEPIAAVSLPVSKGLYSVLLGDATKPNMTAVPATVFTNPEVHLRVWFSDGTNGFQKLSPDRRIAAVGYAMMADSVADGAVTTAKIADGAVTAEKLAPGAVGSAQLANSSITITAGTGLTGGGVVPLGGSVTLTNAGVISVAGGGGITVDGSAGAVTLGSTATSANTAGAIIARDGGGNFSAGTITAALNGNAATATTAGSATNFTGSLLGDVVGVQNATSVAAVGGLPAANIATGATLALGATDSNTASTLVRRDGSGSFAATSITGNLIGNATTATNFTGTLVGDVTGTQGATAIAATTITGKALTGFAAATGAVASTDSILTAIGKLDGNASLKAPIESPSFTGTVAMPAGSATAAPLRLQSGPVLTAPVVGAVEFDGINLFVTNNSASPTRKTVAFTDTFISPSQIEPGTLTSTHLASDLTLSGVTSGSFSGGLTGNVIGNVSGSAASFTGLLAGDVTGPQSGTVVATVAGMASAGVAAGAGLANSATGANTASAIVRRDAGGSFSAGTISVAGSLNLPATSSASTGVVAQGGTPLIHTFGAQNFFAGSGAGNLAMTGSKNIAIGSGALTANTSGILNTAEGYLALNANTSGNQNTASGAYSLSSNIIGSNNTASGYMAQQFNAAGFYNAAFGWGSLRNNTTGNQNTAVGAYALHTSTASTNSATGYRALYADTTGQGNTAVGWQALTNNTTGSTNIALGNRAGENLTTGSNNIHIGHAGVAEESNIIRIGDGTTQTDTYLTGIVHGDGSGLAAVPGAVPWQSVAGTSQQATSNTGYVVTSSSETTVTLPQAPAVGDIVRVTGAGTGGWRVAQNAGQNISAGVVVRPGTAWTARGPSLSWSGVASSADGNKLAAWVYNGQIYTSADAGLSWTARAFNNGWKSIACSSDGTKLVAVVVNGQIYTSTDSGANWTPRDSSRNWSCVASSADGTKVVATVQGGRIYRSVNSGVTWSETYWQDLQWNTVASSADGTRLLAASGSSGNLYYSGDSGTSWIIKQNGIGNDSRPWKAVAMSADGRTLVGVADAIFVSSNGGDYWAEKRRPIDVYSVGCSADGMTIAVPGLISLDSGDSWQSCPQGGNAIAISGDGTRLIVSATSRVFISATETTPGTAGYLQGSSAAAVELQYVGNGRFLPISSVGSLYSF